LWKVRLPTKLSINPDYHGFEAYSYIVMLLGLGRKPRSSLAALDHMNETGALAMFDKFRQRADQLCSSLPSAYEYLASRYKGAETRPIPGAGDGAPMGKGNQAILEYR
jgi:hypothetical protein